MRSRASWPFVGFVVALSVGALPAQDPQPFDFAAAWREVAAGFHQLCDEHGVVGGSLMFVRGADELGFEAHGFADRDGGRRVDRDPIFPWGSCTRTFTGIAV